MVNLMRIDPLTFDEFLEAVDPLFKARLQNRRRFYQSAVISRAQDKNTRTPVNRVHTVAV